MFYLILYYFANKVLKSLTLKVQVPFHDTNNHKRWDMVTGSYTLLSLVEKLDLLIIYCSKWHVIHVKEIY